MKRSILSLVATVFSAPCFGNSPVLWQCQPQGDEITVAYLIQEADGKIEEVQFGDYVSIVMPCKQLNRVSHRRDGDLEAHCANAGAFRPGVYTSEIVQPSRGANFKRLIVKVEEIVTDNDNQIAMTFQFVCRPELSTTSVGK